MERFLAIVSERMGVDIASTIKAGLGAIAIKELLEEIDLDKLVHELRQEINNTQGPKRARAIKRLEIAEAFITSGSRPESVSYTHLCSIYAVAWIQL